MKIRDIFFVLFAIYTRRKYWILENFRLPLLDGFIRFRMSTEAFDSLKNFPSVSLCAVCMYVNRFLVLYLKSNAQVLMIHPVQFDFDIHLCL